MAVASPRHWSSPEVRHVAAVRLGLGSEATDYQTSLWVAGRTTGEITALVATARYEEMEREVRQARAADSSDGTGGKPDFARPQRSKAGVPHGGKQPRGKVGQQRSLRWELSSVSSSSSGREEPPPSPVQSLLGGIPSQRDPPASIPGVPPGGESKEMANDDCQGIPQLPSAGMCGVFGRTSPGHKAAIAHSPPSAGRDELEGSWPRSLPTSLASPEPHSGFVGGGDSVAHEEEANESVVWAVGPMDPECLLPANDNEAQPGGLAGVPVDTAMMPDEVNGVRADLADISDETPSGAVSPGGSVVAQTADLAAVQIHGNCKAHQKKKNSMVAPGFLLPHPTLAIASSIQPFGSAASPPEQRRGKVSIKSYIAKCLVI
ncbi:hypothetical protein HPB49_024258 [Dermacentor silvarum]|uniref:Uncharacterized protein n=1 Tax=Dermacentor silvarum TaxID=543639 RepID=A0ACB8D0W3_DERSI|nr:hypothetical protein HPB49_024258 [Dermacentor silvarum]